MSHGTAILDAGLENAVARGVPGEAAIAADRDGVCHEGSRGVRRIGEPAPITLDSVLTLFS